MENIVYIILESENVVKMQLPYLDRTCVPNACHQTTRPKRLFVALSEEADVDIYWIHGAV